MRKSDYFNRNDSVFKITFIYLFLLLGAFISVYPLLRLLGVALRPGDDLYSSSLQLIPSVMSLDNFKKAIFSTTTDLNFTLWLGNSLIVTFLSSLFSVILSVTAAYAFSRYKFRGKDGAMSSFLVTQMFPAPMLLLPIYVILRKLDLIDHYTGAIIPYVATSIPFCVWTLKGFFDTIPFSIEESAYMDGASLSKIFFRIIIPLSFPGIGVVALYSFMGGWSEYIIAKTVFTQPDMLTLPIGLTNMQGQFNTEWGTFAALSLITAVPVIIFFISMSKFLIGGATAGGVKE